MTDELFSKRLPVTVKATDREDRKVHITVTVQLETQAAPVHRKELVIRLTDEKDLFFLYTLRLNEEDFQCLKVQQGLLVDFGAFPQKFIDLLQLVLQDEHKEVPKFVLDFVCSGGCVGSVTAQLNIIETNPFKYLTHLSLKFLPGTDSDIKKYLAACLKSLKDTNDTLHQKLSHTEAELSCQLRQAREALSARTLELDSLRTEWSSRTGDLTSQHAQAINKEREKALQSQTSAQQHFEQERRELEQAQSKTVKLMEVKIYDLENNNKELTDRKFKSESTIRELKSRLSSLEEEHHRAKQELTSLRKNNAGLDSDYHEQEKVINQLKTRLAVLEQEVKDKEEVHNKTTALLASEQEQKRRVEEDLERRQRQVVKLEVSVKKISEELMKGNEIIKRLQGEIKNYHAKLKLRSTVTTEQEKLLAEKNKDLEAVRRELETTKTTLGHKEEEVRKLNETLESKMQKLEESRQLLKTNENVINWLNKQITDSQLGSTGGVGGGVHRPASGPFEMNSTASSAHTAYSVRPPMHTYNPPQSSALRSSVSGSMQSTPPSSAGGIISVGSGRVAMGPQHVQQPHQPQVQYQPGPARRGGLPTPLAKSSPLNAMPIPEEQGTPHTSPGHPNGAQGRDRDGAGFLDAKYLQQTSEAPLRQGVISVGGRSVSPIPIHFASTSKPAVTMAAAQSTRLSRDIIAPSNSTAHSQPPLASAYFPGQTKVT